MNLPKLEFGNQLAKDNTLHMDAHLHDPTPSIDELAHKEVMQHKEAMTNINKRWPNAKTLWLNTEKRGTIPKK